MPNSRSLNDLQRIAFEAGAAGLADGDLLRWLLVAPEWPWFRAHAELLAHESNWVMMAVREPRFSNYYQQPPGVVAKLANHTRDGLGAWRRHQVAPHPPVLLGALAKVVAAAKAVGSVQQTLPYRVEACRLLAVVPSGESLQELESLSQTSSGETSTTRSSTRSSLGSTVMALFIASAP